uniref:Uncharacterized protein n=1 Tax=Anopheles coluzzii TaxID=1518534 RepID=A0A8W7P1C8_ANOCL
MCADQIEQTGLGVAVARTKTKTLSKLYALHHSVLGFAPHATGARRSRGQILRQKSSDQRHQIVAVFHAGNVVHTTPGVLRLAGRHHECARWRQFKIRPCDECVTKQSTYRLHYKPNRQCGISLGNSIFRPEATPLYSAL